MLEVLVGTALALLVLWYVASTWMKYSEMDNNSRPSSRRPSSASQLERKRRLEELIRERALGKKKEKANAPTDAHARDEHKT